MFFVMIDMAQDKPGKGKLLPDNIGSRLIGHSIIGGITGGIAAELYGGDFWKGFGQGAWTATYGLLFNHMANRIIFGDPEPYGDPIRQFKTKRKEGYWAAVTRKFAVIFCTARYTKEIG